MKFLSVIVMMSALTKVGALAKDGDAAPPALGVAADPKTGKLPEDTTGLAQKAAAAFGKGDWEGASAAYKEMLHIEPNNALAWANLGASEQQAGRNKEASVCFEQSVRFNPALTQSWIALGLIYSSMGDTYRAISVLTRATHEDPTDARAHNYLAIAVKKLGWNLAAESELQKAIALNPDYGLAHFNLALIYLERKPPALELVRRHYDKAIALGVEKDELVERRLKNP